MLENLCIGQGSCELLVNIWKPEKMKTLQESRPSHEPCIRLKWSPTIPLAKFGLRSHKNAGRGGAENQSIVLETSVNSIKHINWEIQQNKTEKKWRGPTQTAYSNFSFAILLQETYTESHIHL